MTKLRKLCIAAVFVAIGVALSTLAIPVGASRCLPVQHMLNVLAGVLLGPLYAVCMAFTTSLIRFMLGTGTLLAFPGSMVGALLCGLVYKATRRMWAACLGELAGTGILGAMACYPIATYLMGREAAIFGYVIPFLISSLGGCIIAFLLLGVLNRTGALRHAVGSTPQQ